MVKKTLLFTTKCSITTSNEQLVITSENKNRTIPIEDIGYVVIDHNETYISMPALNKLIGNNCWCFIATARQVVNCFQFFKFMENSQDTCCKRLVSCFLKNSLECTKGITFWVFYFTYLDFLNAIALCDAEINSA